MPKLTTSDLATPLVGNSHTTINNNFAAVETAMEKTLSRDGTSPNSMEANLDMNSYRILNLPAPSADQEPLRKTDLAGFLTNSIGIATSTLDGLMSSEDKVILDELYDSREYLLASNYGASSSATAAVNAAAINECIVDAIAGGYNVLLPAGDIYVDSEIVVDLSSAYGLVPTNRITIAGMGMGRTYLRGSMAGNDKAVIKVVTAAWTTGTPYVFGNFRDFTIRGGSLDTTVARRGIQFDGALDLSMERVRIIECYQGLRMTDVVHGHFNACDFSFNYLGVVGVRSATIGVSNDGSPVNILLFTKCKFLANRQGGADFYDSSNIVFTGGSFEGNGRTGVWTTITERWGVRIREAGYNGAFGLAMYGVHFETSGGNADIWIDHGDRPCIYTIDGCDFLRNGFDFGTGPEFVTNNIYVDHTDAAGALCRVNVRSGFHAVNSYTPSASRRYCASNTSGTNRVIWDFEGSIFSSATEYPSVNQYSHYYSSHVFAAVQASSVATPVIARAHNVQSVTRPSTGRYTVTFITPSNSANYVVSTSPQTTLLIPVIISRSTTAFTVEFQDTSGVATNPATEVCFSVVDMWPQ